MNRTRVLLGFLCAALGTVTSTGCSRSEIAPVATTTPAESEQTPSPAKASKSIDAADVERRRWAIVSEIEALGREHPWAGEYSSLGTDTTNTISLAPTAGFVKQRRGPGTPCESVSLVSGTLRVVDDVLVVDADFVSPNLSKEPLRYVPIRWGSRRYLVPETRMIDFCNDVNVGDEDFSIGRGWFACRDSGAREAAGKPQLPAPYRNYILDQPLTAKATAVNLVTAQGAASSSRAAVKLVVDAGSNRGVFQGMLLSVVEPKVIGTFRVTTVRETECDVEEVSHHDPSRFVVGIELCTRPRAH
jgi:hypothetical protein